jgi:hydroxymethylpyrimidine/phosphomethylpyrimidine kinase
LFDPTGRIDIPADNVTCSAHHTHGLSVPTGVALADSTGVHGIERFTADQVDDQTRYLVEDIPIQAIKVGTVVCPEVASVIASVAADYSDAPLVLHLGPMEDPNPEPDHEGRESDPYIGAVLELLLPQTTMVVMPAAASSRWLNDEVLHNFDPADGPAALLSLGATWALVTGFTQRPGSLINLLLGPEGQTIALPCQPVPARVQDLSGLTATALACNLAHGQTVPDAARAACQYAEQAAKHAFQAGMGKKLASRLVGNTR